LQQVKQKKTYNTKIKEIIAETKIIFIP